MQDEQKNEVDNEQLYRELFTPIFRYVFFRTRDRDLANDLTQSSFLKFMLLKKRPVEKQYALRLIYTIARSALIDHWRSSDRKTRPLSEIDVTHLPAEDPSPEQNAITAEDTEFIKQFLDTLSETESEIVSMRLASDIDHEEIAKTLGISPANARKIYSRAMQKVGEKIRESNYFKT